MNCKDRLESLQEGFTEDSKKRAILLGAALLGTLLLLKVSQNK
jgi:hypothetical protein